MLDNKRRQISVAPIRDRVVHRLIYDYLVHLYDRTFIYDVWSCRKGKGLQAAINRSKQFLRENKTSYVWRSDVKKFFDAVDHERLLSILSRKIKQPKVSCLLQEIIKSYDRNGSTVERERERERERESLLPHQKGIPIGNLTSQVLSNIYLNEFDRFVVYTLKPKRYLRYGDDFILVDENKSRLEDFSQKCTEFLLKELSLEINRKNDILVKATQGILFLGVEIYPYGKKLQQRVWRRTLERFSISNLSSYSGLIRDHGSRKIKKEFNWRILDMLDEML